MYAFAKHMQDQLQVEHLLERLTSEQAHVIVIVVVLEETEDFGRVRHGRRRDVPVPPIPPSHVLRDTLDWLAALREKSRPSDALFRELKQHYIDHGYGPDSDHRRRRQ